MGDISIKGRSPLLKGGRVGRPKPKHMQKRFQQWLLKVEE